MLVPTLAQAQGSAEAGGGLGEPRYPNSPFHGMRDGDGRIIPCRCRFAGRDFRVGEVVCMNTHLGTVLARCDLIENNTSWMASLTPCELSRAPSPEPGRLATR